MKRFSISRKTALKSVGDGWAGIINRIYDAKPRNIHILQVKEKFGELRVYTGSYKIGQDWFQDLIEHYTDISTRTCEVCGKPGERRSDIGWIRALCNNHYIETKERIEEIRNERKRTNKID